MPPPPPTGGAGFAAPTPPPGGGYTPGAGMQYASTRTDGLAIASLVVGILSLLCCGVILGPVAAIMGFISRGRIHIEWRHAGRRRHGHWWPDPGNNRVPPVGRDRDRVCDFGVEVVHDDVTLEPSQPFSKPAR